MRLYPMADAVRYELMNTEDLRDAFLPERLLVVADREAVVSPGWSIHAGAGTKNYGFCRGMGGENQACDDMDAVAIAEFK